MTEFLLIDTEPEPSRESVVDALEVDGGIWLEPASVERALGFALRDEGLCRGDLCVMVRDRGALLRGRRIGLAPLAEALGRPLALDAEGGVAVLGASAADRGTALRSGQVPDVTLPDLEGTQHTLSHHRGNKVLFIAYASW